MLENAFENAQKTKDDYTQTVDAYNTNIKYDNTPVENSNMIEEENTASVVNSMMQQDLQNYNSNKMHKTRTKYASR